MPGLEAGRIWLSTMSWVWLWAMSEIAWAKWLLVLVLLTSDPVLSLDDVEITVIQGMSAISKAGNETEGSRANVC